MTSPRIVFLPDYGPAVGGGHVMRSLTLAEALIARGARCAFAVGPATAERVRLFATAPVDIWPPQPADWPEGCDVCILDNYAAAEADERALAGVARTVAALDDLGRAHDCNLVVDPGFGRTAADYPGRAQVLAGPSYALVRPAFSKARRAPEPGRVLVSLGLTDVGGITAYVVARLLEADGWTSADVVLGGGAQSLEYVCEVAAHDPRVRVHVDTRDMATLTARADFAVGAGGSSVWERACLSVPTILIVLADNQAPMADLLADASAALVLDARSAGFDAAFDQGFAALAEDPALRARLGEASHSLCDGQGAERVAEAVLALARKSGSLGV